MLQQGNQTRKYSILFLFLSRAPAETQLREFDVEFQQEIEPVNLTKAVVKAVWTNIPKGTATPATAF